MSGLLFVAGSLPGAIVLAHGAWWTLLSLLAIPRPARRRYPLSREWRFAVVIPAHNEEALIARCLASLRNVPFVPGPELVVVADNCTDRTAALARCDGATVLERNSDSERGKVYALRFALHHLATRTTPPDAIVVVDADSRVSPGFFHAIAGRLERGAAAVQVHYAAEPAAGNVPALRRLALGLVHWSRPLGASRLGLGTSLKGNGMAFRIDIARLGMEAEGLAEDAAATLALAAANVPITFEPAATVFGPMASSYREARTQDRRWEGGRLALVPRAATLALRRFLRGQLAAGHGALEVAGLPLSLLAALAGLALTLGLAGIASLWLAIAAAGSLLGYVAAGLFAVHPPLRDLLALAAAPRFLAYKLTVFAGLLLQRQRSWERTSRRR
ncbi:MAG: glycosyltransferase family 2 protein [Dehalococcoidia bacterium]|nr:glycosyltransferase family 2 protein [Dehalococcoidia bacterium]